MIPKNYVDQCWKQVNQVWTQLKLNKPKVYSKEEKQGLGDVIACFNSLNKQVYVDEENLEKKLGIKYLRSVLAHEAGHHKKCPWGLKNFVRLIAHAYKVTKNMTQAKLIENLFGDILINTDIHNKGETSIKEVYQHLSGDTDSKSWQFYISAFEHIINQPGSILKKQPKETMRKDAKKLSDILSKDIYKSKRWPDTIKEFAKYVKKYMEEDKKELSEKDSPENQKGNSLPGNEGTTSVPPPYPPKQQTKKKTIKSIYKKAPLIDKHDTKDYLPFDKDKTPKEIQDKKVYDSVKGIAKEVGLNDFKKVMAGLGLGNSAQAKACFYRDMVSDLSVELPRTNKGNRSYKPRRKAKWKISDPIESLDVEYSLSMFARLIPNVTTYKNLSKDEGNDDYGDSRPDLLIAMDSSGSMPNPDSHLSFPVMAAVLAAKTALECGKQVAVVNFSTTYESLDFTNRDYKIDEILTMYIGGGTTIPGNKINELTSKHKYPTHLLIISDADIGNLSNELQNLESALRNAGAGGTIILDCEPSKKTEQIVQIGYDVQFGRSFDEIAKLTLNKTKSLYAA